MWSKQSSSFTLIEVMVAIFLLTVAIGASFSLIQRAVGYNVIVSSQLQAAYLAQEGIEKVRNQRDSNWLAGNPWNQGIANEQSQIGKFTRTITVDSSVPDKMVISTEVRWSERGRAHTVTAQTELYNWK